MSALLLDPSHKSTSGSLYCSDPNCQSCNELRKINERLKIGQPELRAQYAGYSGKPERKNVERTEVVSNVRTLVRARPAKHNQEST